MQQKGRRQQRKAFPSKAFMVVFMGVNMNWDWKDSHLLSFVVICSHFIVWQPAARAHSRADPSAALTNMTAEDGEEKFVRGHNWVKKSPKRTHALPVRYKWAGPARSTQGEPSTPTPRLLAALRGSDGTLECPSAAASTLRCRPMGALRVPERTTAWQEDEQKNGWHAL